MLVVQIPKVEPTLTIPFSSHASVIDVFDLAILVYVIVVRP